MATCLFIVGFQYSKKAKTKTKTKKKYNKNENSRWIYGVSSLRALEIVIVIIYRRDY